MFSPGGAVVNPPGQDTERYQALTGGGEGQGPQWRRKGECAQNQLTHQQQRQATVGEESDQQISGSQGEQGISPAAAGVALGQALQGALAGGHGGGLLPEHGHIPPTEVETLPSHRMTTMGAFTAEHGPAPGQSAGEATGDRKARRRFNQTAGPQARWQGSPQGLKERTLSEGLALATGLNGTAPDHLGPAFAKGEHRQGTFRTEDLPGGGWGSPLKLHLAGEAALPVIPANETDAQVRAGRRPSTFTVDPQAD